MNSSNFQAQLRDGNPTAPIAIIIPACAEEACIPPVLEELLATVDPAKYVVAVGVNDSTDQTAEIARRYPVIVAETARRGYGHGCQCAIDAVTNVLPEVAAYVFFAGDGASDPRDLDRLTTAYEQGNAMVLGQRTTQPTNWRTMGLSHVVANFALAIWCSLLTGRRFSDLAPLRLIQRHLFETISPHEMTFGWTMEAQIAAALLGARICEVPARERPRRAGAQKVSGVNWRRTVSIGCRIAAAGWRTRMTFARRISREAASAAPRAVLRVKAPTAVVLLAVAAFLLQACSSGMRPALPRQASIEHAAKPTAQTDYPALVASADIIYFPTERAGSGARAEPSALLLDALQQSGAPFAIGWDLIDASQQPLLDDLATAPEATREALIARLELTGTGRAREHCRSILREARFAGARHVALRCPPDLAAKLRSGASALSDEEKRLLAGFTAPPGGLQTFAERLSASRDTSQRDVADSYRAHMVGQQYAAERIVRHFQSAGGGAKLLAFLPADDLAASQGVPRYVGQKVELRQLVLDSAAPGRGPAKLLAASKL